LTDTKEITIPLDDQEKIGKGEEQREWQEWLVQQKKRGIGKGQAPTLRKDKGGEEGRRIRISLNRREAGKTLIPVWK